MSAFGPNRKSRDVRVESETRAITDIQIINQEGLSPATAMGSRRVPWAVPADYRAEGIPAAEFAILKDSHCNSMASFCQGKLAKSSVPQAIQSYLGSAKQIKLGAPWPRSFSSLLLCKVESKQHDYQPN
jgi:hypothetical protein